MKETSYVYILISRELYYLWYISMKQSKIEISVKVLDTIADSWILSQGEKLSILKYVWYMSYSEQLELCEMI